MDLTKSSVDSSIIGYMIFPWYVVIELETVVIIAYFLVN